MKTPDEIAHAEAIRVSHALLEEIQEIVLLDATEEHKAKLLGRVGGILAIVRVVHSLNESLARAAVPLGIEVAKGISIVQQPAGSAPRN